MNKIETLHEYASRLFEYRQDKKRLEEELTKLNSQIKDIEEHKLNDLMNNEGINGISLDDFDVSRTLIFRCGYTKHTDKDAFKFLFDSDNDGALKQLAIVDIATCPQVQYIFDKYAIPYKIEYSIHHATLSSIIKELVATGQFSTEDIEKYNVYVQPQIKVKMK